MFYSISLTPRQIITVQKMVTRDKNAIPVGIAAPAFAAETKAITVEPMAITAQMLTNAAIIMQICFFFMPFPPYPAG